LRTSTGPAEVQWQILRVHPVAVAIDEVFQILVIGVDLRQVQMWCGVLFLELDLGIAAIRQSGDGPIYRLPVGAYDGLFLYPWPHDGRDRRSLAVRKRLLTYEIAAVDGGQDRNLLVAQTTFVCAAAFPSGSLVDLPAI